jgi:serine/threonine-protein kinase
MKICPQCESGYHDSHTTCPTHGGVLSEIRDLKPGMVIHQSYKIVRKLGQGGMGAVYLAHHTLMDEPQALKFLSGELSKDQAFTSRFLREVRTLKQVRHKNVVDASSLEPAEDGTLFFPMEFVDGPDLRGFLRDAAKPFDVKLALEITRGIAEGLGAAHAKGMVHRDIKPENILMAREGDRWVPKIADFGIVATKESSNAYTRTGGTLLTMAYAAPEQWRGTRAAELDGRTDLYALGGVLFEMLTGRTPFEAEGYEGWAEQHKNAAPRPPSSLRADLADWKGLDELVLRMLAKNVEQRPKDVAELLRLLDGIVYVAPVARQATEPIVRQKTVCEGRPRRTRVQP